MLKKLQPEDLLKFGLIPEFIGRIPVYAVLDALDEATLKMILTEPKNAVLKQYQCLLKMDGVDLEFEPDAIDLIAKKAELMLDVMYDIPTKHDITKFVVTKEMVEKQDEIDNTAELIHLPQNNTTDLSQKTRAEIA